MRSPFKAGEARGCYVITRSVTADEIIRMATQLTKKRFRKGKAIRNPQDTRNFLQLKMAHLEHEQFSAIYLDNRHRVLAYKELFRGTIDGASVYPREIVKEALKLNAAAVILAHNHPSGVPTPSQADKQITLRSKNALALLDIRVLDHLIIGGNRIVSMAEEGLV